MEAALLLIISNSYQFIMMRRKFSNSQILDKKQVATSPWLQLLNSYRSLCEIQKMNFLILFLCIVFGLPYL